MVHENNILSINLKTWHILTTKVILPMRMFSKRIFILKHCYIKLEFKRHSYVKSNETQILKLIY